jgi:hypothetical protein
LLYLPCYLPTQLRYTLRSRADQEVDGFILPHNAHYVYHNAQNYQRVLKDGSLSREFYYIPLYIACDEERFEELP